MTRTMPDPMCPAPVWVLRQAMLRNLDLATEPLTAPLWGPPMVWPPELYGKPLRPLAREVGQALSLRERQEVQEMLREIGGPRYGFGGACRNLCGAGPFLAKGAH